MNPGENSFYQGDAEYVAVDLEPGDEAQNCSGCAFDGNGFMCKQAPECRAEKRDDKRSIVWVQALPDVDHGVLA